MRALPMLLVAVVATGVALSACSSGGAPGMRCVGPGSGEGAHCAPRPGLRLAGTGRTLRARWRGWFTDSGPRGWSRIQALPGGIRSVHHDGAPGRVGRFVVRPGDKPVTSGERAEAVASPADSGAREGAEAWYAWSTYVPRDAQLVPGTTYNVITQFHHTRHDPCTPTLLLELTTTDPPARFDLDTEGGHISPRTCVAQYHRTWRLGEAHPGRWYDFVLHVRWSASRRVGLVELSLNGRRVVAPTHLATLFPGQAAALKQGFYRGDGFRWVSRIYHTGVTRFEAARP